MAQDSPALRSPSSERLFDAAPLPPLLLGAVIALAVGLLIVIIELVFGDLREFMRGEPTRVDAEEYRFSVVIALLIGYLPAAYASAARSSRRTWQALGPALRMSPAEVEAAGAQAGRFPAAGLRRAGWIGIVLALSVPALVDQSLAGYGFGPNQLYLTPLLHRLLVPVVGWLFGRNIYAVLKDSARLARAGREQLQVDLLDLAPLRPFTLHGLRNAALAMGTFGILALLIVDWGSRPGLPLVICFLILTAVILGVAGLVLPVRGAHDAIRRAKAVELAACNQALRERRDARGGGFEAGSGIPELLAWRGFVESVREWPFDTSTLVRFLLYTAIPLVSWLGGAVVERGVDAVLG